MPDNDPDLMAEFQEFLNAKAAKKAEEEQSEDYEVEVWNEKGQGARLRRSHAKPFLQSLGIDVDPPADSTDKGDGGTKTDKSTGRQSKGRQSNATDSSNSVRRYFAPKPGATKP